MDAHSSDTTAPRRVTDPVCGMSVDPAGTCHTVDHDGKQLSFCSAGCRDTFLASPDQYAGHDHAGHRAGHDHAGHHAAIGEPPAPGTGEAVEYTCPMHPEIRRPGVVPHLRHGARTRDGDR